MIKHLLFDLDGTLLPIDLDFFFEHYLTALSAKFTGVIAEAEFKEKLLASTMLMVKNEDPALTNEEVFWRDFPARVGFSRSFLEPVFLDFYQHEYRLLGQNLPPAGPVRTLLSAAFRQGYNVTIATNPIFPLYALKERLAWIDCHEFPYRFITSMEQMHFCKPSLGYYRELLDLLGAKAEECLMIGNDMEEDMVAAFLGLKTCLVTDRLIKREKIKVKPDYTCRLAELPQILIDLNE
ncbi:MAG TPA: HAD family hydrolase [Capillibacterium sp.]